MNYPTTATFPISNSSQSNQAPSKLVSFRTLFIGSSEPINLVDILNNRDLIVCSGYREAAYYLQHLPAGYDQLPEIIMGYYDENDQKELCDFARFLDSHKGLAHIPFILLDQKQNLSDKSRCKAVPGIDDIVKDDISPDEFLKKVVLLKKFKLLRQRRLKLIKFSESEIRADRRSLYKIDAIFKRIMDILISAIALVILIPVLFIIALIIKIDSRGPVFYNSYRAGSNYRIFKFIKFRTMIVEADHKLNNFTSLNQYASADKNTPVFFKISNDPRVTRFGKFLRNTSLDELPQFLNVLKGDMSLVGNRPLPLYEAKTLTTDRHAERFNAPAGITGLWQISKRGQKEMSVEERIALDIDYARHNSFVQDLQIMLKTPKALMQKDNV